MYDCKDGLYRWDDELDIMSAEEFLAFVFLPEKHGVA